MHRARDTIVTVEKYTSSKPEREYEGWALEEAAKLLDKAEEECIELSKVQKEKERQDVEISDAEKQDFEKQLRKAKYQLRVASDRVEHGLTLLGDHLMSSILSVWACWQTGTLRTCLTRWNECSAIASRMFALKVKGEKDLEASEKSKKQELMLSQAKCTQIAEKKLKASEEAHGKNAAKVCNICFLL